MRKLLLATAAVFAITNSAHAQTISGTVDDIVYQWVPAAIGFHLLPPASQCGDTIFWYGNWQFPTLPTAQNPYPQQGQQPDIGMPYVIHALEESLNFHKPVQFTVKSAWGCPYVDDTTNTTLAVGTLH